MKKIYTYITVLCLLLFAGCEPDVVDPNSNNQSTTTEDDDKTTTFTEQISIAWDGTNATVSGEVEGVTVTSNDNGYVVITSTVKAVKYSLSGNGNGQFKLYSDYKYELNLNGLILHCDDGPAINSQCKKKGFVIVNGRNSLGDGTSYANSDEDQKATFFSEGQLIFSGTGTLDIIGSYKHALASDDYIQIASGTYTLTTSASDGLHTNDGIQIDGGTITIDAAGDGMQCDTSDIVITGGQLTITAGDKGILAYGAITVSDGDIEVYPQDKGIKAGGDITISGGKIYTVYGGSPNLQDAPQRRVMQWGGPGGGNPPGGGGGPGESSGPEGIESKGAMTISGGEVYAYAPDDAINSGSDLTISGGLVCAHSTSNDGIDANGNCYISGGVVYAIGSSSPEVGIDANSEERKQLYVSGGTLVAIGGLESGASLSQTCYSASSWSKSTTYALYKNGEVALVFITPSSGGSGLIVSTGGTPTLQSGVTYRGTSIFNGYGCVDASSVTGGTNVSLSKYSR